MLKRASGVLLLLVFLTGMFVPDYAYSQTDLGKTSKQERIKASQIPPEELKSISTLELLNRCLEYPYLGDIFFVENIPDLFSYMKKDFNGLNEFFNNRYDAGIVLFNRVKAFDPIAIDATSNIAISKRAFRFYYLELFLAQDEVMKQLQGAEREILAVCINKYKQMDNYNQSKNELVYGAVAMNFTGYVLGRYLDASGYNKFTELKNNDKDINNLFRQFSIFPLSPSSFNRLLNLTHEFINAK